MLTRTKPHLPTRVFVIALACLGVLTNCPRQASSSTVLDEPVDQPHIVTCNFKQTPLRTALKEIYRGSGYEYSVFPDVPDVKITLRIKNQPFHSAIRQFVRTVKKQVPRFHVDMDTQLFVYKLKIALD
jgi:hypothetical protein